MPPRRRSSSAHFTPFVQGAIYAFFLAGWTYQEIADEVEKVDGTNPCQQSVASVVKQVSENGGMQWGPDKSDVGRPRQTTDALDKAIVKLVFKHRGSTVVTAKYVRKTIKAARDVSTRTVRRRLVEAGLAYLRRRDKSLVPEAHKASRLSWASWLLARSAVILAR